MHKKKILVIDDESGFTEMVKLNLEATGEYDVVVENRGVTAMERILAYRPDLVLLDVILPDMEGPDIVRQIRDHSQTRQLPVIFLTATVTKQEVQEQHGYIGGHRFLAKPGTVHELMDSIRSELLQCPN
jgi:CheY-like chemotaxis protein